MTYQSGLAWLVENSRRQLDSIDPRLVSDQKIKQAALWINANKDPDQTAITLRTPAPDLEPTIINFNFNFGVPDPELIGTMYGSTALEILWRNFRNTIVRADIERDRDLSTFVDLARSSDICEDLDPEIKTTLIDVLETLINLWRSGRLHKLKRCEECGEMFCARARSQRYHSHPCRDKALRKSPAYRQSKARYQREEFRPRLFPMNELKAGQLLKKVENYLKTHPHPADGTMGVPEMKLQRLRGGQTNLYAGVKVSFPEGPRLIRHLRSLSSYYRSLRNKTIQQERSSTKRATL